ncbi:MAG: phosphomannose isomerase type II C-terminal cupin domain [Acidobacteriota bacterium]
MAEVKTEIRPWGSFTVLENGNSYKVKRLVVNPGHRFSLQYHRQRSEHWVVVAGVARVTRNEEVLTLKPNETTYLPVGTIHRLENSSSEPLIVIEVQYGNYLGEDDIVRLADDYNR